MKWVCVAGLHKSMQTSVAIMRGPRYGVYRSAGVGGGRRAWAWRARARGEPPATSAWCCRPRTRLTHRPRPDHSARSAHSARSDRSEHADRSDRSDRSEHADRSDRSDQSAHSEHADRSDRSAQSASSTCSPRHALFYRQRNATLSLMADCIFFSKFVYNYLFVNSVSVYT